ncbi:MAG TPA: hypothetical protein VLV48_09330, partial [Thermoanaerobaculia bacterium]|nr:hypothetical protein [Thermoanaerobaculia bacterium]
MRKALASILLALAAIAALAAPQWVEDYERGLAAIAASDWTKVAIAMQSAAKQNPNEAVTLKLRRRTVVYVPWYWLGVAQLETGDAAGALQSLRTSARQGVIDKTPLYGDFRKALSRAEAASASPRTGRAPAAAATYQNAVKAAVASQGKAMLAGSTRSETYRKATLKLQEARERARSESAEDLAEGTKLATQAEEMFRRAAAEQASARKTSKTVRATMQPQMPAPAVPAPAETAPVETASAEVVAEIQVPMAEPASVEPEPAAEAAPAVTQPAAPALSPRLVKSTESMLRTLRNQASTEAVRRDPRVVTARDLDQIEMRLLAASSDAEVGAIRGEIARELDELRSITAAATESRPAKGELPAATLERA